jgi:hypothetical protein
MIPDIWKLIIVKESGTWSGTASKQEGCRRIEISTYDSPQPSFESVVTLLEERIKL